MNEAIRNIYERRSCRSFLAQQITEAELKEVLDAGMQAPSAMNQQSWFMVAIQNPEKVEAVRKLCVESCKMQPDANPFYGAPTIILVFGKQGNIAPEKDASLAMQNMMLAAQAMNLGSCWINCVNPAFATEAGRAMAKEFGLPDGYAPVGSLALGLPSGVKPRDKQVLQNYVIVK